MARVDYDRMAADYQRARSLTLEGLAGWREALADYLPAAGGLPVLDLGAGTGMFASAIAGWFGVEVVAVEPSAGMRAQARRRYPHPRVLHVGGRAEQLPLRAESCGAAWLSTVIHHLADLRHCARALREVLPAGAPVLIRSAFPGRLDRITLFRYFPGAARVAGTYPTVAATVDAFAAAGFALEALRPVPQVSAPSLRVYAEHVRPRADSTLAPLPDAEFARGMAALERAAAAEAASGGPPRPIVDELDLLALRAGPA